MAVPLLKCSDTLVLHQCKTCGLYSNEKTQALFHNCENANKNEVMYSCAMCTERSYSILWLFLHQIEHGLMGNEIEYNKTIIIKRKKKTKSERKFYCDQCAYIAFTKCGLDIHFNAKHASGDEVIWHKCNKCNWKSKYPRSLKGHLNSKHFELSSKRYQCKDCNYQSDTKCVLKTHILQRHTPDHLIKWHNCQICSYRGKQRISLRQHMKWVHTPDDELIWFKCDFCGLKTKSRQYLKNHIAIRHSIEKEPPKFHCTDCVYVAGAKSHLKSHIIAKHTPDHLINWYYCHICNFRAKRRPDVNSHIKSMHTCDDQLIKFSCRSCTAIFKYKRDLKRHMVFYHSNEVNCYECNYRALDFIDLRNHLKNIHSRAEKRFECSKCWYDSNRQTDFERHLSVKHS